MSQNLISIEHQTFQVVIMVAEMMEHSVAPKLKTECLLASCICYRIIRNMNFTFFSEIFPEAEPTPHPCTSQLEKVKKWLVKCAVVTVVKRLLCSGANWRTHVSAFAEWRISAAASLELIGLLFVLKSLIASGIISQPQGWAFGFLQCENKNLL